MNFPHCTLIRQRACPGRCSGYWSCLIVVVSLWGTYCQAQSSVEVEFFDKDTSEPIAARIEFTEPIHRFPRPKAALVAGNQILVEESAKFAPSPGKYAFVVERGPEFSLVRSGFEYEKNALNRFEVYVPRKTPMRAWGWHSGDLLSSLSAESTRRWMRADDLDIVATLAPRLATSSSRGVPKSEAAGGINAFEVATNASQSAVPPPTLGHVEAGCYYDSAAGQGGVVVYGASLLGDSSPLVPLQFLLSEDAKKSIHVSMAKPWERDVPLVLATEAIDSVQVLSAHLLPDADDPITSSIRNPDRLRFQGKKGLGRLGEYLYWQMLEAGIELPPTAGSGFDNRGLTHLGYNRVYVWIPEDLPRSSDTWWQQLSAGHTVVTNGPLLRATINGSPPGSRHLGTSTDPVRLDIALELTVRDPVEYLDVVFNGKAIYQARLDEHQKRGTFPELMIDQSGWLVLRVVTEYERGYRLATTAPFYFEIDGKRRVSKRAVGFFRTWLDESIEAIVQDASIQNDVDKQRLYATAIDQAKTFWQAKLDRANAE